MNLRIANTLTDSLAKLSGEEQKEVGVESDRGSDECA